MEEWLARCRWLATTRLDDRTRSRLERLIIDLEYDLDEDEWERRSQRSVGWRGNDFLKLTRLDGLKHSEVRALVADRVLTNDWRRSGDAIAINEHALCDLCSEVSDARDKFQGRTKMARKASARELVQS